jgi:hypothetical protein
MGGRNICLGFGRGVGVAFGLLGCRLVWGVWYMCVLDCVGLADGQFTGVRRYAGLLAFMSFPGLVYQGQRFQFVIASVWCVS